eukprot:1783203-Alexandrium_andersonii.AAC.1
MKGGSAPRRKPASRGGRSGGEPRGPPLGLPPRGERRRAQALQQAACNTPTLSIRRQPPRRQTPARAAA